MILGIVIIVDIDGIKFFYFFLWMNLNLHSMVKHL